MKKNRKYLFVVSTIVTSAIAGLLLTSQRSAATATFTDIGTLGYQTSAHTMNDNGAIVGSSYTTRREYHAFLWLNGQMNDLGIPGSNSMAYGINNNNEVVGVTYSPDFDRYAFLWQSNHRQDLTPILGQAIAYDINDNGKIVGSLHNKNGIQPFLYDLNTGKVTRLADSGIAYAINNNNDIVGFRVVDTHYRATLWSNGDATDLGTLNGHASSAARNINDLGEIVGWSTDEYGWEQHAFYWKNDTMQAIGPSSGNNDVFAINDSGQVIGTNEIGDHIPSAFIWQNGELHDINVPDMYTYGMAINNSGQFVVNTSNGKAYVGGTPKPSPSLEQIITDVEQLLADNQLHYNDARLLLALLEKAEEKLEKQPAACHILAKIIGKITLLKQQNRLDEIIADSLILNIQSVRTRLEC